MSIHKLTAGSGYDYLTRQVAALDATDKGRVALATYYTERGETPGVWLGRGLNDIDGLDAGDRVTAEQMKSLFGSGHHPLADARLAALQRQRGATAADALATVRLGAPFRVYDGDVGPFRVEVARRLGELNAAAGLPRDWPAPMEDRARVRTEVARELFLAEHGRPPADDRELGGLIAQHTRARTTAVAGFDLTFSPVKSVSVLWAVADTAVAAVIEEAHRAAVADALRFIEDAALFTRLGVNGVRQVDVRGLVATAFTHRDSRAGDPDLHTHVAVANKVQTLDGRWRAIDGRVLFRATVSASETYNTALERHLHRRLGLRFQTRAEPGSAPAATTTSAHHLSAGPAQVRRAVREVVGVDPALNQRFSKRRVDIEMRRDDLGVQFQASHGRPPTSVETLHLAQQATLETRQSKHEPRTLAEQRRAWAAEARAMLGSDAAVAQMVAGCLPADRTPRPARTRRLLRNSRRLPADLADDVRPDVRGHTPDAEPSRAESVDVEASARQVLQAVQATRATWTRWHVYAEAQRQIRADPAATSLSAQEARRASDAVTQSALSRHSVALSPDGPAPTALDPPALHRRDGAHAHGVAGSALFSSAEVLAAERRLLGAAGRRDGRTVSATDVQAALESHRAAVRLNDGQAALVRDMATSGARVQLAIAPAGSGKTTAMDALVTAWRAGGGQVVGLAPSAAAADALRSALTATARHDRGRTRDDTRTDVANATAAADPSVHTDTLAKLVHSLHASPGTQTGTSAAGSPRNPERTPESSPERLDPRVPEWVSSIDATTLVIIDEAGMADTLSLDAAVSFVLDRGGSVRLVGDDQQLAAVGAGGVLRDIATEHGALHLTELVRFADPAEGSASLAIRDAKPEALGFYLDRGRVHVGDEGAVADAAFQAWRHDRDQGRDALMLAPTHALVADLNHRARLHRLSTTDVPDSPDSGRSVLLADGNLASVGDTIITRTNDRRLRLTGTDWVKNGDRWIVTDIPGSATSPPLDTTTAPGNPGHDVTVSGDIVVRHLRHGLQVRLPRSYVAAATGLGYACTVHSAQGVTADACHSVAGGNEARQVLYTMLTRGRTANHVYLPVVGFGDPHDVVRPTSTHPPTATDLLEASLARDETPRSATTTRRDQLDPANRLRPAVEQYLDSLHLATEHALRQRHGDTWVTQLEHRAEVLIPGLADQPSWATLRARLLQIALDGNDPVAALTAVVRRGGLDQAHDPAAVLTWRLEETTTPSSRRPAGPLPWLPPVPEAIAADRQWGRYLTDRAHLVESLAASVHQRAHDAASTGRLPEWADHLRVDRPDTEEAGGTPGADDLATLVADLALWRAATGVEPTDNRPAGPRLHHGPAARWQHRLAARASATDHAALAEWGHLLDRVSPGLRHDSFAPVLARRLAGLTRAGVPATHLVDQAATRGPLPEHHAAAALWWRICAHVEPPVDAPTATAASTDPNGRTPADDPHAAAPTSPWATSLTTLVGHDLAHELIGCRWWPALVTNMERGTQRGWLLPDLLGANHVLLNGTADDICQALVWRSSVALDPIPDPDFDLDGDQEADQTCLTNEHPLQRPSDNSTSRDPERIKNPARTPGVEQTPTAVPDPHHPPGSPVFPGRSSDPAVGDGDWLLEWPGLAWAAAVRRADHAVGPRPEITDAALRRIYQRGEEWDTSPITRLRMLQINNLAQAFFESRYPRSWAQDYLVDRFRTDPAADLGARAGYAPRGWTTLTSHLRNHGVSNEEMVAAGISVTTRHGRVIDRFRDRVVFPIVDTGAPANVLGFVARRHPDCTDTPTDATSSQHGGQQGGPKYLNTPTTPLFHKGAHLFGAHLLTLGGTGRPTPVLVEGPMDAIAITLAGRGQFLGLASLGSAITPEHAAHLAALSRAAGREPVVATDADQAGRASGQRAFWLLARHALDATATTLPEGLDPAGYLHEHGAGALALALQAAAPIGHHLLTQSLAPPTPDVATALTALAARPPQTWSDGLAHLTASLPEAGPEIRRAFAAAVERWVDQPEATAHQAMASRPEGKWIGAPSTAHPPTGRDDQQVSSTRRPQAPPRSRDTGPSPTPR